MHDALGDRMKGYEARETGRRFLPMLPVVARIDGRCFSNFTRGMDRPFDATFTSVMQWTAARLVEETGALAGYTQSDEISLLWYRENPASQIFFDGKVFKMTSVLSSLTTSIFIREGIVHWPERFNANPVAFDARVFQVPTKDEAANAFLWRELDATKNAVHMVARSRFSHKQLHGKSSAQMQEMLWQDAGVNFNDFEDRFKRGTFYTRRTVCRPLDAETLAKIPEQHRPTGPIERSVVERIDMPKFSTITNRVGVLFDGEEPVTAASH